MPGYRITREEILPDGQLEVTEAGSVDAADVTGALMEAVQGDKVREGGSFRIEPVEPGTALVFNVPPLVRSERVLPVQPHPTQTYEKP